jgi:dihydroorotate dehydrogenase
VNGRREQGRVNAMGVSFASALGVAAGVDRTGERIGSLDLTGFGHIEIGTVGPEDRVILDPRPPDLRIGVNFGSSRSGLDDAVIADYLAALRLSWSRADYLCANLSSPRAGRDGNSAGAAALLRLLRRERDLLAEECGRRIPLLVKLAAGNEGEPPPAALRDARKLGLDGVVLVCGGLSAVAEARRQIGGLALISVGGVGNAGDAAARLAAGADLVQVHTAFVAGAFRLGQTRRA